MPPEAGAVHELSRIVTPEVTADAMGHRGVKVFATPYLISLLEDAAGLAWLLRHGLVANHVRA